MKGKVLSVLSITSLHLSSVYIEVFSFCFPKGIQKIVCSGIYQGVVGVGLHRIVREAFTVRQFSDPLYSYHSVTEHQ